MLLLPPRSTLFPYTTLFRSVFSFLRKVVPFPLELDQHFIAAVLTVIGFSMNDTVIVFDRIREYSRQMVGDRKSTRLNSSHANISYAVFCLKKKKKQNINIYV